MKQVLNGMYSVRKRQFKEEINIFTMLCKKHISRIASQGNTSCIWTIPLFHNGLPVPEPEYKLIRIAKRLRKQDFKVLKVKDKPFTIFIKWSHFH